MSRNVAQQLIAGHLVSGNPVPGEEIALRIDQTLTQDATGTLVMLELEAIGLDRARTDVSVQYVDHNLLQTDSRNADDHRFLRSAAQRFGLWYSKPGNGVSHPTHMQRFGVPGATLIGSDSHTCAGGALGMLAIGVGGLEVAMAITGRPLHVVMPQVWGVELVGELPEWVSAKDVVLEMLRRHGVKGGLNRIIEYHGPGLSGLSAMDRHVIANMGAELGATATVFPSDEAVREFLTAEDRAGDWIELTAEPGAGYDLTERIDLSELVPLVAKPTSPGNVVSVTEVAGEEIGQVVIGSSANPGLRDFAIAAAMVKGRQSSDGVSFDVNPSSRQIYEDLTRMGSTFDLIAAGARIHQSGCMGCIGMGQAPASGSRSLRTFPRNFPGRSGTVDDRVYLCSPETAAASALTGVITDPRLWARAEGVEYPKLSLPERSSVNTSMLVPPLERASGAERVAERVAAGAERAAGAQRVAAERAAGAERASAEQVALVKGPNIASLPEFDALPERLEARILLKLGDDISTDEILPAGAKVLPLRSNIPAIAEFCFEPLDPGYPDRAREVGGSHAVVAGGNYGQGSSREHAALAPRYLGLRLVLAKSFARIHWQNLANFGIVAVEFVDPADHDRLDVGQTLAVEDLPGALRSGSTFALRVADGGGEIEVRHRLSGRQVEMVCAGGLIPQLRVEAGGLSSPGPGRVAPARPSSPGPTE